MTGFSAMLELGASVGYERETVEAKVGGQVEVVACLEQ